MTNLHPIFVHFPIALLCLYSLITILPVQRFFPKLAWSDIKSVLLFAGIAGAFLALQTGDFAAKIVQSDKVLVETHETFASAATLLYGALCVGIIVRVLRHSSFFKKHTPRFVQYSATVEKILTNKIVVGILAFLGLAAIAITGLLGGVIVYGTSADPFAAAILAFLGIQL